MRAEGSHPTLAEIFFQTGIYWGMPNMVGRILESDMLAPQPLFDTTEADTHFCRIQVSDLHTNLKQA